MFNFLNKKKEDSYKTHISSFSESYSEEQKAAIIRILFVISGVDGQVHPKELDNINSIAMLLDINPNNRTLKKLANKELEVTILILNSLEYSQKEWLVVVLHGMIFADGKVDDREIAVAIGTAEKIGISEEAYVKIIEKTDFMMKEFGMYD